MTAARDALAAHLADGASTVCRCWSVTRRDGVHLGFTDHDMDVAFGGITYRASSGFTASAFQQSTGLAVDNSEVQGVLSDQAITEADVEAGRFDGALVAAWLVNWSAPDQRVLRFKGTLGEIERSGAAFKAELRGLAEAPNEQQGFVFQSPCSAVLGDGRCGVDLSLPGMSVETEIVSFDGGRYLLLPSLTPFDPRWFEQGRIDVLDGQAAGLAGAVKADRLREGAREIELWEEMRAPIRAGDRVRLVAGCDRRAETCRVKFGNFLNFRGFPHIPGEDWQMAYPSRQVRRDGGSLFR